MAINFNIGCRTAAVAGKNRQVVETFVLDRKSINHMFADAVEPRFLGSGERVPGGGSFSSLAGGQQRLAFASSAIDHADDNNKAPLAGNRNCKRIRERRAGTRA